MEKSGLVAWWFARTASRPNERLVPNFFAKPLLVWLNKSHKPTKLEKTLSSAAAMTCINYFMPSALCSCLSSEVEELGPLGLFVPSLLKNVVKVLLEVGVQDLADQGLCLMLPVVCSGFSTWSNLISWQISTRFHLSAWTHCSLCAICNQNSRFLLALKPHTSCCGDSGFIIYSGEKLWKAYERYPILYIFYFYHDLSLLKKKQLFDWVKKVWMIIWVKLSVEYILTNFVRLCKQEGTILFKKVRLMLISTPKFQTFNDK